MHVIDERVVDEKEILLYTGDLLVISFVNKSAKH